MEQQTDSGQNDLDKESTVKKVKKSKKEEPTLFRKKMNLLENSRFFAYPALIMVIVGVIGGIYKCSHKTIEKVQIFVHEIKAHYDLTNTNISKLKDNPTAKEILTIINKYYADVSYGKFKAANYYAPHVDRFIMLNNMTPVQVDSAYVSAGKEFISPNISIHDTAFCFLSDEQNYKAIEFWITYKCFRKSKRQYEHCNTRVKFVFDNNNKITLCDELAYSNLKFSNNKY
jgi:hypothetical protein